MKNFLKLLAIGTVLTVGIAWAANWVPVSVPQWFKAGIALGPTGSVATSNANRITTTVTADIDYDFASATIVCNDSWNGTATGVKKGDPCFVGIGPRDGGSAIVTANSVFMAIATADDTVVVRHCPVGTAANPADAGDVVRCISNQ